MSLPMSGEFIPAISWDHPKPDISLQRDNAFSRPTIAEAVVLRPRWSYSVSAKRIISRYLLELDAREINESITQCRSKYGDDAVTSVELHIYPDTAQTQAGVLRAYGYERCIALESSGVEELCFITHKPRLMKREATE
jgi:hypothetical protein